VRGPSLYAFKYIVEMYAFECTTQRSVLSTADGPTWTGEVVGAAPTSPKFLMDRQANWWWPQS